MGPTSDQTLRPSSSPVLTTVQTLPLVRQGCPERPHLFARAHMHNHPNHSCLKSLIKCGQCGQYGHSYSHKGLLRPHLALVVGTVRAAGMFHANPRVVGPVVRVADRRAAPSARVLPGLGYCGCSSAHFSHMFCVPTLVPNGTRGHA